LGDGWSVEFVVVVVDVAEADATDLLVAAAGAAVDIRVNDVGLAKTRVGGFLTVTDEQWYASLDLNLMAAVRTTRAVLPGMLAAGARHDRQHQLGQCASARPRCHRLQRGKGGTDQFHQVAVEGIRSSRNPGQQRVPGAGRDGVVAGRGGVAQTVENATGQWPEDVARGAAAASVTGRFTHPEEVADVVLWLASERATNITGATVIIDGGLITTV
jgi:NAD(P)-dependent dehydrogenase (short-subunit alcohol dehydrogenase family)